MKLRLINSCLLRECLYSKEHHGGREVPQESSQCYMSPNRNRDVISEFSLCERALKYSLGPITVGCCALLNIWTVRGIRNRKRASEEAPLSCWLIKVSHCSTKWTLALMTRRQLWGSYCCRVIITAWTQSESPQCNEEDHYSVPQGRMQPCLASSPNMHRWE